jgi:ABC-type transport system involved in multi-copper enzyme maturation permease subunit
MRFVGLSARLIGGRRFWIAPLLTLLWPAFQALRLVVGWQQSAFEQSSVQTALVGFPMIVLSIGLGVRIIADEIDRRTLEIAYTVPGGAHRVWLGKLAAAFGLLVVAECLLAVVTFAFFAPVTLGALYGALQAAVFYLVLSMGLAVLTRSEITGALAAAVALSVNGVFTGFGGNQLRVSPTFNPLSLAGAAPEIIVAYTLQNRVGVVLAIAALTGLAFARAERREKLLG